MSTDVSPIPSGGSATDDTPTVSVVVPMYNEAGTIGLCIESLQWQDYPLDRLEVVVADGMSRDASVPVARAAAARRPRPEVRILPNPRRNTASGLNVAVAAARGEVILRLDAHAVAPPGYVRTNVNVLLASGADYVGGRPVTVGKGYWGKAIALATASRVGVGARFHYGDRPADVDTVAFGAFRRETYRAIGPFDEGLLYSEDNEYTYRIRARGGRVHFDPAISFTYYTRSSLPQLWRQYGGYGWGRMRHALRDRGGLSLRHLLPLTLAFALAVLLVAGVAWPPARWVLGAVVAAYVVATGVVAAGLARGPFRRLIPALPLVFACLHLAYGVGQWKAIAAHVFERFRRRGRTP